MHLPPIIPTDGGKVTAGADQFGKFTENTHKLENQQEEHWGLQ